MRTGPRLAGAAAALVTVPFIPVLADAFRLCLANGLQTYAPLTPVIATYVARGSAVPAPANAASFRPGFLPAVAALSFAAVALAAAAATAEPTTGTALRVLAWLALLAGALRPILGPAAFSRWRLPLVVLLFIVPLPGAVVTACEDLLQHASATCARLLLGFAGTPVHLDHLTLNLPGISLWVAPECSGLRSSLSLLLLTAVAAGTLLRTTTARLVLCASVGPIAVLRNGLRIFVIGSLCVRDGPAALDSTLHRHGGPVFFALSLVPWALLLALLRRREEGARPRPVTDSQS